MRKSPFALLCCVSECAIILSSGVQCNQNVHNAAHPVTTFQYNFRDKRKLLFHFKEHSIFTSVYVYVKA
jgi:hypothetical protein